MQKFIDHIGVAVPELEKAAAIFKILGLHAHEPEEVADQKVFTQSFQAGDNEIELLKPTAEESPIAKFLEKKGTGIHHVAIRVDDIESEIELLKAKGVIMIDDKPRPGAGGKMIAFIHPKSTGGILIELTQINSVVSTTLLSDFIKH